MPWSERLTYDAVWDVFSKLLLYRHRFNASQKSVIALFFVCVAAVAFFHWLHLLGVLIVYALFVHLSTIKCNDVIQRVRLYRSERILVYVDCVRDAVTSVVNLFETKKCNDVNRRVTKTGHQSNHYAALQSEDKTSLDHSLSSEDETQLREMNTVIDEIERFLNLIMRDFVQSWYKTLSPDPDVVEEIHEILYQAAVQIYKSRFIKLNVKKLSCDVIKLYHQHLAAVIICKSVLKSQPKRRRSSTTWIASLDEAFQQKFSFHEAVQNKTDEINYIRSLVDIILVRLLPPTIHRCRLARDLLTEILACNVVLPLIDKMSARDWIYEVVTEILAENKTELINIEGNNRTDELHHENIKSTSDNSHFGEMNRGLINVCSKESIQYSDTDTPHMIPDDSLDKDEVFVESEDTLEVHLMKDKKANSGLKTVNGLSQLTQKESNTPSKLSTGTYRRNNFTVDPPDEVTISNIRQPEKPQGISSATCLGEEAGENIVEKRQPPNGKAATHDFKETTHSTSRSGSISCELLNLKASAKLTPKKSPLERSTVVYDGDSSDVEDISHFKDVNSDFTYHTKHLNGISENTDTFKDPVEDISIPVSLIGPSIKVEEFIPEHHHSKSVQIPVTDSSFVSSQNRRASSVEPMSRSKSGDVLNRSSDSIDIMSRSSSSLNMSQSSSSHDIINRCSKSMDIMTHRCTCTDSLSRNCVMCNSVQNLRITSPILRKFPDNNNGNGIRTRKASLGSLTDLPVHGLSPHSDKFYLSDQVEDAEDVDADTEGQYFQPQENWAHLASNIPNSDYESALANCMKEVKPDEYKVLELKSRLFHSVSIPNTDIVTDRGSSTYTVYKVEFEAWYWSGGEIVLRKGYVMRRFREFVDLQARLDDDPIYKTFLKGVKGPKRWMSLPFGNMDKSSVESRRKYLERFLQAILEKECICNGEEIKEFLAYEGKSHIAFVRKAPELSVPRIDKMLVKTVSGVYGKLMTVLPTLSQDRLPSLSRKEPVLMTRSTEESSLAEDEIELNFGIITDENPLAYYDQFLEEHLARILQDEMPTIEVDEEGMPVKSGGKTVCEITDWDNKAIECLPVRSDGDGSATPRPPSSQNLDERCYTEIPLARSVLDLGVQSLLSQGVWVCRESVIDVLQILLGRAMDRWLEDQVTMLSSTEQCCLYMELLRDTIWPHGKLSTEEEAILSDAEKLKRKEGARKSIKEFLPRFLPTLIGDEELDKGINQLVGSVESEKLNRHFLFTVIDMILERLFPELTNQLPMPQRS